MGSEERGVYAPNLPAAVSWPEANDVFICSLGFRGY